MKTVRTFITALFVMSVFSMAGCNRYSNRCGYIDQCSPCEVQCPMSCDPCPVQYPINCDPCPMQCAPCQPTCQPSCCAPCQPTCQPSCCDVSEENAYFPCDPTAVGCGNGNCYRAFEDDKCYGRMIVYKTCDDCVVDMCQRAPDSATVGSPYPIEIVITARKECADVMINQTLPCDSQFIRSEPCVQPSADGTLHWEFPHMVKGESQTICVWVKPMREGCCMTTATVCACPQLCSYTTCGQPVVCIKKWGPECACLYCPVCYTVEVCNSGSAVARDVIVEDSVPEALVHASGRRCLTYELGDLCPGESRRFNVEFCANQRGCATNVATVSYCGGPKCSAEATTMINEPCVEVTKTGPEWAYICKPVTYTITVTNPGDLVLYDVIVDDVAPPGTIVTEAPGAEVCCGRALWCIPELCPCETKTFTVTVKSQAVGCLTNKVTVSTNSVCGTCTSCAEATTCWQGIAATHMCMVDTVDPICVGETTIYRVCITNRGSADDSNVKLVINFSSELEPQSSNGPTRGTIAGNSVTFEPVGVLAPKQSVEYCVVVKGVAPGDARAEAVLSSDALGAPINDVEGTHVY